MSKPKRYLGIMLFILFFSEYQKINAQAPNWIWAKAIGGTLGYDYGNSIAIDPTGSGDVYTTGYFEGTVDFDPGAGTFNLTSAGSYDIFISRLDSSGNFIWAKAMGGTATDFGVSIALDPAGSGDIYATGAFGGTVDFDPGPGTFNLTSVSYDIFISKLDGSGNFVWAKAMGGIDYDHGYSIALDPAGSGDVYTTGYFRETVDFDPGAGTFNLASAGFSDIFISKLNASGNFMSAKRMGGIATDFGLSIALDPAGSGDVYITGTFGGTADFDPGPGTFSLTATSSSEDIFISKLDGSGNFVWAKRMGGTGSDYGYSITLDPAGNGHVYTTGYFSGTVDFDPGAGIFNLTSASFFNLDIFISKLDSSGNFIWAKRMGGTSFEYPYSIALDPSGSGDIYTIGQFAATVDFDPGPGTFNLTSAGGSYDIFISKLDSSGNFVWAKAIGGTNYDVGLSIALDPSGSGNVHVTGAFHSPTITFGSTTLINADNSGFTGDIFIAKLDVVTGIPLPIDLISFYGKASGDKNILYWTTVSEINNNYFTILKSTNGINFETIGTVKGAGNSTQHLNYSLTDTHPLHGINYYVLQQTDYNGQTSFSKTIAVNNTPGKINPLIISPNPAHDFIQIIFQNTNDDFEVVITSAIGQTILKTQNKTKIDVSQLSKGVYFLRLKHENNFYTQKFIIQ